MILTTLAPPLPPMLARAPLSPFGLLIETEPGQASLADVPPSLLARHAVEERVVVLRGFGLLPKNELCAYGHAWGEVLSWDFGEVLDLVVHDEPKNYLFTRGEVPFHWDGAFARATPSFFLFQCLRAQPGGGGDTVLCDTTRVLARAEPELRALWERVSVTYRTEKVAHYGGQVTAPLVSRHPLTGEATLRYAEPLDPQRFLNPLFLTVAGLPPEDAGAFMDDLSARLHAPEHCYHHAWRTGDIVVADNHALLHGRSALRGECLRHLQRIQVIT